MFSRILVPTDFSTASDAALDCAKELAKKLGASLSLVHVVDNPIASAAFGTEAFITESPEYTETVQQEAERQLAVRLTDADRKTLHATSEILDGPCAETIVDTARARGSDLIVMGTHGRRGFAHAFMGSVAERVVRLAPCPVLTLHAPQKGTPPADQTERGAFVL